MTDDKVKEAVERIAEALFNSGACSVGYRGDMRMEQCAIHAKAVAPMLEAAALEVERLSDENDKLRGMPDDDRKSCIALMEMLAEARADRDAYRRTMEAMVEAPDAIAKLIADHAVLQAERDKLSEEVERLTELHAARFREQQRYVSLYHAERIAKEAAEAKLTALVEAIDLEIKRQRGYENAADYNGSFAGSAEARAKIKLLEELKALAHHSAPVGEDRRPRWGDAHGALQCDEKGVCPACGQVGFDEDGPCCSAMWPGDNALPTTPTSAPVEDVGGRETAAFNKWSRDTIQFKGPTAAQERAFRSGYRAALSPSLIQPQVEERSEDSGLAAADDNHKALVEWRCLKCGAQADERWDCCEVREAQAVESLKDAVVAFLADEDAMMESLLAEGKKLEDFGFPFPRVIEMRQAMAAFQSRQEEK